MTQIANVPDRRGGKDRRVPNPPVFEGKERRQCGDRRTGPPDRRSGLEDRRMKGSDYWVGPNNRRSEAAERRRLWRFY